MKNKLLSLSLLAAAVFLTQRSSAQVSLSAGTYSQNFNSLPSTLSSNVWANNSTLPGWYSRAQNVAAAIGDSAGTTNIIGSTGTGTAGVFYSLGTNGVNPVTERALGTICSGTSGSFAYGLRFVNDTGVALTNFVITYTGEEWRNGGNASQATQPLAFSYRVDSNPIIDSDPTSTATWTAVPALNFISPTTNSTAGALDGNNATNRITLSNVQLGGFAVLPGQEIFLRWLDINDAGNDHALAIDDLTVSFSTNSGAVATAPTITTNPASITIAAGNSATFTVSATGTQPFTYEWYLTNAGSSTLFSTASSITTNLVTLDASGIKFYVIVANAQGSATSSVATLTVTNAAVVVTNIAYLHTLQDANFALTNTTTLFQATGIVTTPVNLVSGSSVYSFHIQDATGGIDVFHRGGFSPLVPSLGDQVRVTGPLLQFNGLLEFAPTNANPTHNIEVLSSGNPLPAPLYFDFTTVVPATMESTYEGRYVVVSNVFIALTNEIGGILSGTSIYMTNLTGQTFRLFNPAAAIGPQGNTPPAFATSVKGVMTQADLNSPFNDGYDIYLFDMADIEAGTPPTTPSPVPLTIQSLGDKVVLSWTGPSFNLQASLAVEGTYTNISGATSPYTNTISGTKFFRLKYP